MAYFLKKNFKNNKLYLSIVNSYYDHDRGHTVHETYASFGTGQSLIDNGISDPVAYLTEEVRKLNYERNLSKTNVISDKAPYKYAGHFLLKAILGKLEAEPIFKVYDMTRNFHFQLYDVLSSLIYARCIKPCSKFRTYFEVIPYLDKECTFSYDQLLEGLAYFGENYESIVEIFTKLTKEKYGMDTSKAYFDCTNFYFEIDKEDEFRKKGPSKENRKEPLLGMGLLLDGNQIPSGMKLFPGNESEKPKVREIIHDLKRNNDIEGRVIQVADKGLNSSRNIYEALKNGDGYIFSKSCKTLPEVEKTWILLDNDYIDIRDEDGEIRYRVKECIDTFSYSFTDDDGGRKTFSIEEKEWSHIIFPWLESSCWKSRNWRKKLIISAYPEPRKKNLETVPNTSASGEKTERKRMRVSIMTNWIKTRNSADTILLSPRKQVWTTEIFIRLTTTCGG